MMQLLDLESRQVLIWTPHSADPDRLHYKQRNAVGQLGLAYKDRPGVSPKYITPRYSIVNDTEPGSTCHPILIYFKA